MIEMVNNINKTTFRGQARVSCFTCHQGPAASRGRAERDESSSTSRVGRGLRREPAAARAGTDSDAGAGDRQVHQCASAPCSR
jgi:hypothetical protein